MGQYGNQPDFGTKAKTGVIQGTPNNPSSASNLGPAALYIGTGGTLVCRVVGGNTNSTGPAGGDYTVFKNIPNGTFFPVIVDVIWTTDFGMNNTTCSDIIALY